MFHSNTSELSERSELRQHPQSPHTGREHRSALDPSRASASSVLCLGSAAKTSCDSLLLVVIGETFFARVAPSLCQGAESACANNKTFRAEYPAAGGRNVCFVLTAESGPIGGRLDSRSGGQCGSQPLEVCRRCRRLLDLDGAQALPCACGPPLTDTTVTITMTSGLRLLGHSSSRAKPQAQSVVGILCHAFVRS